MNFLRIKDEAIDIIADCKKKDFHLHSQPDGKLYEISSFAIEIDEGANKIKTWIKDMRVM